MPLASIFSFITVALGLLAPFVNPSLIKSNIYLVSFPLIVFVGLGSIFSSLDSSRSFSPTAETTAHVALGIFIIVILALSNFGPINNSCSQLPLITICVNPNVKSIRRIAVSLFALVMAACLPYWLEFGPQNTGLVSLLTDPSSHLIAREESFKLATVTPFFKLYRIGASFSGLAIVFLWMEFFAQSRVRRLFSLFSILLLTLASNINGSRGGFLTPSLVSFYSLYICNFHSWRDISVATLYELKKGLVIKELISTTVRLIAICGLIFSFLVLISIRRTGRVADTVLAYDFVDSLIQRFFAVRFETGVMNIEAIKSLLLGPLDYIGGFPGAGMIFGERESIFMLTGRYFSLTNLGFDNATNLNTSGLFLNVGVWHFLGLIIFVSNILFNVVLFGKYALAFASSPKQILFSAVAWGWLLSTISFNIIEGELASFSTWLLFPFLMYGISKV